MVNKKFLIILCALVVLLSLSASFASDVSSQYAVNETSLSDSADTILAADNSVGTFDDFYTDVYDKSEVTLTRDYVHSVDDTRSSVMLMNSLTINGNGHTIDCLNDDENRVGAGTGLFILYASGTLTLNNVKFINCAQLVAGTGGNCVLNGVTVSNAAECQQVVNVGKLTVTDSYFYNNQVSNGLFYEQQSIRVSKSIFIGNRGTSQSLAYADAGAVYFNNCIFIDNEGSKMFGGEYIDATNNYWGEITNPSFSCDVDIGTKYSLVLSGPDSIFVGDDGTYTIKFNGDLPALEIPVSLDPVLGTVSPSPVSISNTATTITVSPTSTGTTSLKIGPKYNLLSKSIEFQQSTKSKYSLTVSVANTLYTDPIVVNVNLKDKDGAGVAGTVVATIDNTDYNIVTNANGVGSLTINDDLAVGTYDVDVQYNSLDPDYLDTTNKTSFTISIGQYDLAISTSNVDYRQPITVDVTLKDEDDQGITGNVVITLNGVTHDVEVTDGVGSITFNDRTLPGEYTITAKYTSTTTTYEDATASAKIIINDIPLKDYEVTIDAPDSVLPDTEIIAVINLKDAFGNPVITYVNVSFGNEKKLVFVDGDTIVKFNADNVGKFDLTVSYITSDEDYRDVLVSKQIAVKTNIGNFAELEQLIKDAVAQNSTIISLEKDYKLGISERGTYKDGIKVNGITIDGNGYTIDCANDDGERVRLFYITGNQGITINNLNILNAYAYGLAVTSGDLIYSPNPGVISLNEVNVTNCGIGNTVSNGIIYVGDQSSSSISISKSNFISNIAVAYLPSGTIRVSESTFINNTGMLFNSLMYMTDISKSVFINNSGSQNSITYATEGGTISNSIFINNKNKLFETDYEISGSGNYFGPNQKSYSGDVSFSSDASLTISGDSTFSEDDVKEFTIKFSNANLPAVDLGVNLANSNLGTLSPVVLPVSGNEAKVTLTPKTYGNTQIIAGQVYGNLATKDIQITQSIYKSYELTVSANDVSYGENVVVTVTLKDENGDPVSGTVNIAIGDINKEVSVNGEGSIEFPVTVAPNKYSLKASYASQDPAYKDASATTEITVSKAQNPVSLAISANEIKEGASIVLTATLEKLSQNQVIAFYNGTTLLGTNKTNEFGVAVLNIKPTYGLYEIHAQARGNNYYLSSESAPVNLNVIPLTFTDLKLESSASVIMEAATVSFNVTLTDSPGNPFANTNVLILVNNVNEFNLTTDANGKASFNLDVDTPGVVYVLAKYLGDDDSYANQSVMLSVVYSAGNNFNDLDLIIQSTPENFVVTLVKDYIFDISKDTDYLNGITITKNIIIDGNGHSISGANMSTLFNVNDANVVFKNVNLVDAIVANKPALSINNGELTLVNSNVSNIRLTLPAGVAGDVFTKDDVLAVAAYVENYYRANNQLPSDVLYKGKSYPLPWISDVLGRAAINYYQNNFDDIAIKEVSGISGNSGVFDSTIFYTPAAYLINSENIERGGFTSRFVNWIPSNGNQVPRYMGASPNDLYFTSFVEGIARSLVLYGENGAFQDINFIGNIAIGAATNTQASVLSATGSKVNLTGSKISNVSASDLVSINSYDSEVAINDFTLNNVEGKTGLFVRLGSLDINNSTFTNIKGSGENMGGAITTQDVNVNIKGSKFSNNIANENNGAGGCLKVSAGTVTIESTEFENSSASVSGAIFADGGSNLYLTNVTIRNNTGVGTAALNVREGSAITIRGDSKLVMVNSTIADNKELKNIYGSGSGEGAYASIVMIHGGNFVMDNCVIANNSAPHCSVIFASNCNFDCSNSLFINNTGGGYGVLCVSPSSQNPKLANSTFIGNAAKIGGAIFAYKLIVENSTFINNTASQRSGAIESNNVKVYNSTFIGNKAPQAAVMGGYTGSTGLIQYSIFINNKADNGKIIILHDVDSNDLTITDFNSNYWGTNNDPNNLIDVTVYTETTGTTSQYSIDKYITLDVIGDSETYQTLPTNYTIKFVGGDADKLPSLNVTVEDNHENATMTPNNFIISSEDSISQLYAKNYSDLTISVKYGDITLTTYDVAVKELIRKNYTFTIEASNVTYGEDLVIDFKLFDEDGIGLNKTIVYYINGTEYSIDIEEGVASETLGLGAGKYVIKANYTSTDFFYNNASAICNVTVAKAPVNIVLTVKNNTYGEMLMINATVDKDLEDEDIYFTLKDFELLDYYPVFIENNSAILGVTGLKPGSYYLNVTFEGNDNYLISKANLTFEIYKIATKLSVNISNVVYGQPIAVKVNLTGISEVSMVKVIINGTEYSVNMDKNGIGQLIILDKLKPNTYNFTAQFSEDEYHNASVCNGSFVVTPANATLTVTIADKKASQDVIVDVTLKQNNETPITGNVTVVIDGIEPIIIEVIDGVGSKNIGKLDNKTYNFTATFDSDCFSTNNCTGEFVVTKLGTVLEVEINETKYGQEVLVGIKLFDSNDTGVTAKINVTIGDKVYEVDVVNGTAIVNAGKLDAGSYDYNVSFKGLPDQGSCELIGTFTVRDVETNLNIEVEDLKYSQDAIINITLIDELNNPVNGTVSIKINNKEYKVNVTNGSAKLDLGTLNAMEYNYEAQFDATNNYKQSTAIGQFKVEKLNTTLTVTIGDVTAGKNATIKVKLVDEFGNPVDAYVYVTVGNETYRINAFNGTGSKVIAKLPEGSYAFNATYAGQVNYNRSTDEGTFNVVAYSTVLTIDVDNITYGENATIIINLVDSVNNPVDAEINVTFNNRTFTVATVNGTVVLIVPNLNAGDYVVNATFRGNAEEFSSNGTAKFTVYKGEVVININVTSVVVGNDVVILISMVDGFGVEVVGNVNVTVANTTVTVGVNKVAKVTVPGLATGNYTVTVDYPGSANYNATVGVAEFEVKKLNSTMDIVLPPMIDGNKNTTIVIKLDRDASGEVILSIGSQIFTAPVIGGTANVLVSNLTSRGVQNVVVTYSGDNKYEGCTKARSVNITNKAIAVLTAPDIELYYRNGTKLVVYLKDVEENPLGGQVVYININGVDYKRTLKANGTAVMDINLPVGVYDIAIRYDGNSNYSATNITTKVTVLSTIIAEDLIKYFQNDSQFDIQVLDGHGKPVVGQKIKLNINGVFYERTTKENGMATMKINLGAGKYTVSIINQANEEVLAKNITVLSTIVDNHDLIKYFQNGSQYTVKALDAHGNAAVGVLVQFNINGVIYDRHTNENGTATMKINLGPGHYVITVMYNGLFTSNNVTVLSTIVSKNIEMTASSRVPFVVTVLDDQGNPVSGQNLSFNINGVIYHRVSNENGSAKLNINLMPAEYIITTMYKGLSQSNTILIKP